MKAATVPAPSMARRPVRSAMPKDAIQPMPPGQRIPVPQSPINMALETARGMSKLRFDVPCQELNA
jgi:hypothetical protein